MPSLSSRRRRHGRGSRGPMFAPFIPLRATWAESFDAIVMWHRDEIRSRCPEVDDIDLVVRDAPRSDPAPWESSTASLCRAFPADRMAGLKPQLVFYRLPIHARVGRATIRDVGAPLHALIRTLLVEGYSELTGMSRDDLHGHPID